MGEITREFLGLEPRFLAAGVERLLARDPRRAEFARTLIVVPGRRAKRRFEELFAERAPKLAVPPRAITVGELAPALSKVELAIASPLAALATWRASLSALPRRSVARLWNIEREGRVPWTELAGRLRRSIGELWAEGWVAADVETHLAGTAHEFDLERWRAVAEIEASYRQMLERRGELDRDFAATWVHERRLWSEEHSVILLGVVDLPRAHRRLLEPLGSRATAWICDTEGNARDYDAFGALELERFVDRDIELDDSDWSIADHPHDAARLSVLALAEIAQSAAPHEVTVGVLDDALVPFVAREFDEQALDARWAGGRSLVRSRPMRLVAAAFEFLAARSFESFAALVRHPDLEDSWRGEFGDAASLVDAYANLHLPTRVERSTAKLGGAEPESREDRELEQRFARLVAQVDATLAPLDEDGARAPREWAEALVSILRATYAAELALGAASPLADALERVLALLQELAELDDGLALERAALAELIAARARDTELPASHRPERTPIELLGWLELPLDDAPHLILVGVDEGVLPTAGGSDAFLPESLRRELGLGHEARRVARDTWILALLARTRRSFKWISTRKSATRDPRTPSRLVFRSDAPTVVRRVQRFFGREPERRPPVAGATDRYLPPRREVPPPSSMRVTDFRRYLESPYGYYLERVLGLETLDDSAMELDARHFGSLVHDVLERFGRSPVADSTDFAAVRDFLCSTLRSRAAARYGDAARPAVRLQIANLELRLERFAAWQVARRAQGWRIAAVELDRELALDVDGRPMRISGRIDRMDRHEGTRKWSVIDYKSGDKADDPESTHRKGRKGSKRWVDLQLPLYRELVRGDTQGEAVELAYVRIAGGLETDKLYAAAEWGDEELAMALELAADVVRAVRRGEFDELGDAVPRDPILAAIAGYGLTESELAEEGDES